MVTGKPVPSGLVRVPFRQRRYRWLFWVRIRGSGVIPRRVTAANTAGKGFGYFASWVLGNTSNADTLSHIGTYPAAALASTGDTVG